MEVTKAPKVHSRIFIHTLSINFIYSPCMHSTRNMMMPWKLCAPPSLKDSSALFHILLLHILLRFIYYCWSMLLLLCHGLYLYEAFNLHNIKFYSFIIYFLRMA